MTLKTEITEVGQEYKDEPIYAKPAPHLLTPIADACARAFGNVGWAFSQFLNQWVLERTDLPHELLVGHRRVKLNWKRPVFDKSGSVSRMVPR